MTSSLAMIGVCLVLAMVPRMMGAVDMFGMINTLYFKADKNLDYIITEPELNSVYQGFDANGDHKVTHDEFTSLWQQMIHDTDEEASAYFFLADIDDNGVITDDDVKPTYARFDMDGDGQVEAQEFNLKWQEIYRESSFAVLYLRTDTNHDDDLQADEYPKLFGSLSSNADGSISRSDFQAKWVSEKMGRDVDAQAVFAAMDTDHDGTMTTQEVGRVLDNYDFNGNKNVEIIEVVQEILLLFIESSAIRPDLVVWDKENRTAQVIDVCVPNDYGLNRAEREKVTKYQDLKNDLKKPGT